MTTPYTPTSQFDIPKPPTGEVLDPANEQAAAPSDYPVPTGNETAAELRALYRDLIDQPDLETYALNRTVETFGGPDIQALFIMATSATPSETDSGQAAQAKEILFRMHYGVIEKFLRRYQVQDQFDSLRVEEIRDAGTEALFQSFDRMTDIHGTGISGYMWTKMRYRLYDFAKSSDIKRRHQTSVDELPNKALATNGLATPSPEDEVIRSLTTDSLVVDMLLSLDERERRYFTRKYGFEPYQRQVQIAATEGITPGALKQRVRRAEAQLRLHFGEHYAALDESQ